MERECDVEKVLVEGSHASFLITVRGSKSNFVSWNSLQSHLHPLVNATYTVLAYSRMSWVVAAKLELGRRFLKTEVFHGILTIFGGPRYAFLTGEPASLAFSRVQT